MAVPFPNLNGNSGQSILFANCPNMQAFVLRNSSVVQLQDASRNVELADIGGSNVYLYVPDNLVNDYKSAAGWSNIADHIKGISELPS